MKLYLESLYHKKIFMINLVNIFLVAIINIVFSNALSSNHIQYTNREAFMIDYLYQGILFNKINIFVLCMVLVYQTKYIKGILALHTIEEDRLLVIVKYYLSMMIILVINIIVLYLIFEITGLYLTVYFNEISIMLLMRLILFGVFVLTLLLVIYFYIENIYSLLLTLIFYFIVVINSGFYVDYNEISFVSKVLNFVVSDLVLHHSLEYLYIYGDLYVICLIMALLIVLVRRFIKTDLM